MFHQEELNTDLHASLSLSLQCLHTAVFMHFFYFVSKKNLTNDDKYKQKKSERLSLDDVDKFDIEKVQLR